MSSCDHNCASCKSKNSCSDNDKKSFLAPNNKLNNIKKIYAIHSGKGGVRKVSLN